MSAIGNIGYTTESGSHWILRNNNIVYDFTENYNAREFYYVCPADGKYQFKCSFSGKTYLVTTNPDMDNHKVIYLIRLNNNFNDEQAIIGDVANYMFNSTSLINEKNIITYLSLNNTFDTSSGGSPSGNTFLAPRSNDTPTITGSCSYFSAQTTPLITTIETESDLDFTTPYTELKKNDIIKLQVGVPSFGGGSVYSTLSAGTVNVAGIEVRYSGDTELFPAKSMPDMKQIDFIKSLVAMFNLYITVDEDKKTVFVEKRDDFFKESIHAIDWTDKIIEDTYSISPVEKPRDRIFKYVQDKEDVFNNTFEDLVIKNPDINASGTDEISASPFAPTVDRIYITPKYENINIPTLASEEQIDTSQYDVFWEWNYAPRILKWEGLQPGYWVHDDDPRTTYPYATFQNPTGLTLTWDRSNDTDGLYINNYFNTTKLIEESAYVELSVNLNQDDINNFDFRLPVKIGNNVFYVQSINNYRPAEIGPTNVKFVKLT